MKKFDIVGLMSGSSLDGLDLVDVEFTVGENIRYLINCCETIAYDEEWQQRLSDAFKASPAELKELDVLYGAYLGELTNKFIAGNNLHPQYIASHGHTIFHKPEQHYTLQIGNGQALADACQLIVINDFRSEDVSKGGQGAPLVPIGDKILFADFPICLNIGGIANVSYDIDGKRTAYDICIANQMLNYLSQKDGLKYDKDGQKARNGRISEDLLKFLNTNSFYTKPAPKSLGREFFETFIRPRLDTEDIPVDDKLATAVEHIAMQIGSSVSKLPQSKMLITGGGALNTYLIERIGAHNKHQIIIPGPDVINYKEALIFALLGVLRITGQTNVLSSVTGASSDSSSGIIWHPVKKNVEKNR